MKDSKFTLDETQARSLLQRIRLCDPGRWLSEKDVIDILANIELLESEIKSSYDSLAWFGVKVKANADHYGHEFDPGSALMHRAYADYKYDLRIFLLHQPWQFVACLLRNWGLRRSFISHHHKIDSEIPGSTPQ